MGRLLLLSAFNVFICQQYIMPLLFNSVSAIDALDLPRLGERLLKLALPCTYVWLAGFYAFFHVWLNVLAELPTPTLTPNPTLTLTLTLTLTPTPTPNPNPVSST